MLHILIGPSGVGKTTIIRKLMFEYCWNPIVTYCTRDTRRDDINKIFIDHASFGKLKNAGFFYSIQSVHNNHYGQSKNLILHALESKSHWVFDISYEYIEPFLESDCDFYIVLCENEENLIKRLKKAERPSRIEDAIKEQRKLKKLASDNDFPFKSIVNKKGEIDETISKFIK